MVTATDGTAAAAAGQSLRGQLQLHCCAPLSLAFLSELKPSHGISNFCFQPGCGFTARSSPVVTPSMVGYLQDSLMGHSKRSSPTPITITTVAQEFLRVEANHWESIQSSQTIHLKHLMMALIKWIKLYWVTDFAPSATRGQHRKKMHDHEHCTTHYTTKSTVSTDPQTTINTLPNIALQNILPTYDSMFPLNSVRVGSVLSIPGVTVLQSACDTCVVLCQTATYGKDDAPVIMPGV